MQKLRASCRCCLLQIHEFKEKEREETVFPGNETQKKRMNRQKYKSCRKPILISRRPEEENPNLFHFSSTVRIREKNRSDNMAKACAGNFACCPPMHSVRCENLPAFCGPRLSKRPHNNIIFTFLPFFECIVGTRHSFRFKLEKLVCEFILKMLFCWSPAFHFGLDCQGPQKITLLVTP